MTAVQRSLWDPLLSNLLGLTAIDSTAHKQNYLDNQAYFMNWTGFTHEPMPLQ